MLGHLPTGGAGVETLTDDLYEESKCVIVRKSLLHAPDYSVVALGFILSGFSRNWSRDRTVS
jgi:hypothetical protein